MNEDTVVTLRLAESELGRGVSWPGAVVSEKCRVCVAARPSLPLPSVLVGDAAGRTGLCCGCGYDSEVAGFDQL